MAVADRIGGCVDPTTSVCQGASGICGINAPGTVFRTGDAPIPLRPATDGGPTKDTDALMLAYCRAVWKCRYFWMSLVHMDLRTRYRRSFLGIGWSLLHPIAMTAILCAVFARIFNENVSDFAPYLLAGLCCWNF